MQEIGIEGPRMRLPGQSEEVPFYVQHPAPQPTEFNGSNNGPRPRSGTLETAFVPNSSSLSRPSPSILRNAPNASRTRGESVSSMSKRVDFSLGMKGVSSGDMMGDVYDNNPQARMPSSVHRSQSRLRNDSRDQQELRDSTSATRATSRDDHGRLRFGLGRSSTESQSRLRSGPSGVHRNRFFGRRAGHSMDGAEDDLMEQGMADIPEAGPLSEPADPRTGMITSQAIVPEENTSDGGTLGREMSWEDPPGVGKPLGRSWTEDFELRKLKK